MCDTDYISKAKRYLNAIRSERQSIERDIDMVRRMEDDAVSITAAVNPDRVLASKDPHSGENKLIVIADAQKEIDEHIASYNAMRSNALNIMLKLEDGRHRTILGERYLNGERWPDVADKVGYEQRQMFRLHGSALLEFGKLL